jgi:hypothetical protein
VGDDIELDVDGAAGFVDAVLDQAGRRDLVGPVDERGTTEAMARELLAVATMLGASVAIDERAGHEFDRSDAHVLVPGTKVHLRMHRIAWLAFLALVPIVASAVITGDVALPLLSTLPLLGTVTENATLLSDEEKLVYVTVVVLGRSLDRRVTSAEIHARLDRRSEDPGFDEARVVQICDRLVARRVLTSDDSGYAAVT